MTRSADESRRWAAISSTLPRPANSAGSGRERRPPRLPTTVAPADLASASISARRFGLSERPKSRATTIALSPVAGLSNIGHHAARCVPLQANAARSEEHTSELQSHSDLVCRLLLEK